VIRTAVAIKSWIAQTPSVEEVRPVRCAGCGAASRPVGGCLNVHGQGLMERQVRGVLEVDGEPGMYALEVRRYELSTALRKRGNPAKCAADRQNPAPV
jgi:hypothetical protein